MAVDIGKEATDRPGTMPSNTVINSQIAATPGGKVTSIDVRSTGGLTGVKIGIFYLVSGTTYKCRSSVTIGDVAAGFQNIDGLSLRVAPGDLIGMYWATGSVERSTSGESDMFFIAGDSCNKGDQATYAVLADDAISLGGYITASLTVTIQSMTDFYPPTAKAHGNVVWIAGTSCTQHGHCWNTTGTPTIADDKTMLGAAASVPLPFESTLTDLLPYTLYYVRAYATDGDGTVYSNEITFFALTNIEINPTYFGEGGGGWNVFTETEINPSLAAPAVTTDPAVARAAIATLNGTLDSGGGIQPCDCGFEWGETVAYGNTTPTEKKETGETFSQVITGLLPNTTYHFKAFATGFGTSDGADRTFVTTSTPNLATLTTDPATAREKTAATLNGTLDDDGGEFCDCGFEYGETTAYGTTTPTEGKETGETFSQDLTGLDPGTTYHFRAIATNSAGTSYGSDRVFSAKGGIKGNPNLDQLIYHHVERIDR